MGDRALKGNKNFLLGSGPKWVKKTKLKEKFLLIIDSFKTHFNIIYCIKVQRKGVKAKVFKAGEVPRKIKTFALNLSNTQSLEREGLKFVWQNV